MTKPKGMGGMYGRYRVEATHAVIAWHGPTKRSWAVVVPDDQWTEEGLTAIRERVEREARGSTRNGTDLAELVWEIRRLP